MPTITELDAREILDSRGRPTIEVTCTLADGIAAAAQVPSGASTGAAEAVELRDQNPSRHAGLGCRQAASNVMGPIAKEVCGQAFDQQSALDTALCAIDGTDNKSNLGANAVLGVSLAFARAHAKHVGLSLYQHFANQLGVPVTGMPQLTVNLWSGGKHAGGQLPIQDVLLVPNADSIEEALEDVCAVYRAAVELSKSKYEMRKLTADEGGLAPPFPSADAMFEDAICCIEAAGKSPGENMHLAVDVAASHFHEGGRYHLGARPLTPNELIDTISHWVDHYPIVSVEDGLAEEDWEHWPALRQSLRGRAHTLGDDLLCTNPVRIARAIRERACDALLLKVNQIGTLTEAAKALQLARDSNWSVTASARSGETEDNWLADVAVGWGADHIKVGSVNQSERLAKYNRLLAIEREVGLVRGDGY